MNIIDLQERLKDLPEQSLMQEMQMPTGTAPQFLVLSELKRRKRMRDEYQRQQAQGMQTVAEEAITAAGMPQEGIMGISQAMAPRSAIAQDTGVNDMMQAEATRAPQPQEMPVQGMYDGGYVRKMQVGGFPDSQSLVGYSQQNFSSVLASDPTVRAMAERMGVTVDEYIASLPPETRARSIERLLASREPQGVRTDVFDATQPMLSQVSTNVEDFLPAGVSEADREQGYSSFLQQMNLSGVPENEAMYRRMMQRQAENALLPTDADLSANYRASLDEQPRFAPDPTAPESGGLASPPQPLYPPVPEGSPVPSEEPSFYTPPDRSQPMSPMERLRAETEYMRSGEGLRAYNQFRGVENVMTPEEMAVAQERQRGIDAATGLLSDVGETAADYGVGATAGLYGLGADTLANIATYIPGAESFVVGAREQADIAGQDFRERVLGEGGEDAAASSSSAEAPRTRDQGLSYGLGSLDTGTVDVGPDGIPLSFGTAATDAATQPDLTTTTSAIPDGGGGGGGGGGALGSIESRVASMIEEREKSAQADKWLALAQTGLALMASDQPTIGGAIGEAGLAGIGAMQQARSAYDKDILTLLNAQAGLQRSRASGGGRSRRQSPAELKGILDYFSGIAEDQATVTSVNDFGQEVTTKDYSRVPRDLQVTIKQLEDQYLAAVQGGIVDYNATQ
jgi:hypothetical protein